MNINPSNNILSYILKNFFRNKVFAPGPIFSIITITLGLFLLFGGTYNLINNYYITHNYLPAICTITQAIPDQSVTENNDQTIHTYTISIGSSNETVIFRCPKIRASYLINNQVHDAEISIGCANGPEQEKSLLTAYPVGQERNCWYDPKYTSHATFDIDSNAKIGPYFWMTLGLFIIIWVGYHYLFPQSMPKSNQPHLLSSLLLDTDAKPVTNGPTNTTNNFSNSYLGKGIVLLAILISILFGVTTLKKDWEINHDYLMTSCQITDRTIQSYEKSDTSHNSKRTTMYQALIHANHQIDSQPYNAWISPSGMSYSDPSSAQNILNQYHIGQEYSCWYNPKNPSDIVLQRGYSIAAIMISFIMAGVMIYALFLPDTKKHRINHRDAHEN